MTSATQLVARCNSCVICRALEQGDAIRRQRPAALETNAELKSLWEQYQAHDINPTQLLDGCVEIYFRIHREDYRNFVGHPSNTEEDNHEDKEQLFVSLYE